ncbi:SOS response-associated peptidase [Salinimicrobium soli]|uniref:SOS response-associated peptidase n=1 Tax=Salinimicrobium soli TaxID=1254399 RepID=UPI003AAF95D2
MCYRTKLNAKIVDIEKAFEATFVEPYLYDPKEEINGFDFSGTPVITDASTSEILFYNWGLIPFWAKNEQIKKHTLNAKIETLAEKPTFRNVISNRCLVIANGFYEWQWQDAKGRQKQKYLITSTEEEIFAFAGLYSRWKHPDSGEEINSYSIVTTEANELMSEIHNIKKRMPVVLHHSDQALWLSGKDVTNFAFPYEVSLKAEKI